MTIRRPLAAFAASWVTGGAAASALDPVGVLLACAAAAALLAAAVLAGRVPARTAAACLTAFALAAGHRIWADARNVTVLSDLTAELERGADSLPAAVEGTIVSAVEIDGDRVSFRFASDTAALAEEAARAMKGERIQVQLKLADEAERKTAASWRRGDRATLTGGLERPSPATNFGGFDYRAYLYRHRIHWVLRVDGADGYRALGRASGPALFVLRETDRLRGALGARMDGLFPEEQSGYMKGLVLGLRDDLDPELYRQYAELGLTHILAISGLHVAVFLFGVGGILRLCRLPRETVLEWTMAAVPFYVLLAGASPSVVRAGLMAMIGLLAARLNRLKDGLNLLGAAALAMLIYDPYYAADIGFQLSFAVTAGLILFVPPVRRAVPTTRRTKAIADLAVVTVVAQAVSFPLSIHYFNQFHLLSLPANAALVPFISFVVMPLGSAALLAAMVWPAAGALLADAAEASNDATFALVGALAELRPFATIWPSPPVWWMLAWYGLLGLIAARLPVHPTNVAVRPNAAADIEPETMPLAADAQPALPVARAPRPWRRAAVPAAAALLLLAYGYAEGRFDRSASVAFFDVGQGDAALIRTQDGRHVLVDGGGTISFAKPGEEWRRRRDPYEVGRKTLVPLLMKRGVRRLDLVVATHLDGDHIGGLKAVLESIPVKALLWNGTVKDDEEAKALLRLAAERGVPTIASHAGLPPVALGPDAALQVLWPPNPPSAASAALPVLEEQNERSVVLLAELGGYRFLLSGDIGAATEREIARRHRTESADGRNGGGGLRVHVLKAAHHGSRYSTSAEWLAELRPAETVVSAGSRNLYGHPHPDTVRRIEAAGSRLRRTDRDGETLYRIAGGRLEARTALSGRSAK